MFALLVSSIVFFSSKEQAIRVKAGRGIAMVENMKIIQYRAVRMLPGETMRVMHLFVLAHRSVLTLAGLTVWP